jgi:predicted nucleic acid-binding protein
MQKVIISDTSCLILLERIGHLDLLNRLFGTISVTQEIVDEFGGLLTFDHLLVEPRNRAYQTILEASLDKGESSAIAFAMEHPDCLLIIDDLKGRRYAEQIGIRITGTLGILADAKRTGVIESVKPLLEAIRRTDFRLTPELEQKILELAGEM